MGSTGYTAREAFEEDRWIEDQHRIRSGYTEEEYWGPGGMDGRLHLEPREERLRERQAERAGEPMPYEGPVTLEAALRRMSAAFGQIGVEAERRQDPAMMRAMKTAQAVMQAAEECLLQQKTGGQITSAILERFRRPEWKAEEEQQRQAKRTRRGTKGGKRHRGGKR